MSRYHDLLSSLRDAFPAPVSDPVHDGYVVFSLVKALDRVDALKSQAPILGTPREPDYAIENPRVFERLVTAAFSQRRKTLGNALRKQLTPAEIAALDIDPRLRPERITPAEYARMANLVARRTG